MVSVSKPNETKWFRFRPKPPGFAKPTDETIFKPKTTLFKDSEIILSFYLTNFAKKTTEYDFFSQLLFIVHFPNYQGKNNLKIYKLKIAIYYVGVCFGFSFGFGQNRNRNPMGFGKPKPKLKPKLTPNILLFLDF